MNTEISAGGIVVYHSKSHWLILMMKDQSGQWTFPKGKLEPGESSEAAARREIAEEVGLSTLVLKHALSPVSYWYFRNGSIKKTVMYFLFESMRRVRPEIQKEEGIELARWVNLDTAIEMIGYPKTNLPLLIEVKRLLINP